MSKPDLSSRHFQSKISKFCELRISPIASKRTLSNVEAYLSKLISHRRAPPLMNGRIDWAEIAHACRLGGELTGDLKKQLRIALDAILRWLGAPAAPEDFRSTKQPSRSRCLVPVFDGALFSQEWRDALWDRFYTGAPARQRQSVERYNIVKRA